MPTVWTCELCGARGIGYGVPASHKCNDDKMIEQQIALFDQGFKTFLSTPNGRFAQYYAKWVICQGFVQDDMSQGELQQ